MEANWGSCHPSRKVRFHSDSCCSNTSVLAVTGAEEEHSGVLYRCHDLGTPTTEEADCERNIANFPAGGNREGLQTR